MVAAALLIAAAVASGPAVLRVCADPNNLPFSNAKGEGFENRIAELVARDLGLELRYTWWAQRRGFFRNTLKAGLCDVVVGVPARLEMVAPTRPYYRSSYVFVARKGSAAARPPIASLDDPRLRTLRVGVPVVGDDGENPPPAYALARRGIVDNVVGFTVYGDYTQDSPPLQVLAAVEHRDVDVAIVWGPLAGFAAKRRHAPFVVTPVSPARDDGLPFTFEIAMGVRRGDDELLRRLDDIVVRRRADINHILADYGVPQLR